MKLPRITIVTPVLNQVRQIEATIDSVLSQGYPDLQYTIIDGGSRDGTVDVIKRFDRYLAGWSTENDAGPADALNKGFARTMSTSQLLAYVNAGNSYAPGALRGVADTWKEMRAGIPPQLDRDDSWIVGDVANFAPGIQDIVSTCPPPAEQTDDERWLWFCTNPVHQAGSFWSTHLFHRFGAFDALLRYAFDYSLFLKFRILGDIHPLPVHETIARAGLHAATSDNDIQAQLDAELLRVREQIQAMLAPSEQREIERQIRQFKADRLQVAALVHVREGQRTTALAELAESLWHDPRLIWQRRTAGCLKRIVGPQDSRS
ncbi:MAG: glycosyltransferase [Phycisphaerae bacterium]